MSSLKSTVHSKNNFFFVLILFIITSLSFALMEDYKLLLLLITLFLISGMQCFKFELIYPFVWLAPATFLYNVSVVVLDVMNIRQAGNTYTVLLSVFIAISTLFIYSYWFVPNVKRLKLKTNDVKSKKSISILLNLLLILLIIYVVFFVSTGIQSKSELSLSGGLPGFGTVSKLFIFTFILYLVMNLFLGFPISKFKILLCYCSTILISVIIGERDVLLTLILSSIYIWYIYKTPSKSTLYFIFTLSVLFIPILSQFKAILYKDVVLDFNSTDLIVDIFSGEFLSSGRNFETILNNNSNWDYYYGKSLITDFLRSICPPFIYEFRNSVYWFNNTFHLDRFSQGYGLGFSYLAEGYINFGYFGIVLWYFILSIVINRLYLLAFKNAMNLTIYLFMIPNLIYLQRGDMSYLFSPLVKQVFLFWVIIKLINISYAKYKV